MALSNITRMTTHRRVHPTIRRMYVHSITNCFAKIVNDDHDSYIVQFLLSSWLETQSYALCREDLYVVEI